MSQLEHKLQRGERKKKKETLEVYRNSDYNISSTIKKVLTRQIQ